MKHGHVDQTLTMAERSAPFALAGIDREPIEGPTRLACVWDGADFTEHDILPALRRALRPGGDA